MRQRQLIKTLAKEIEIDETAVETVIAETVKVIQDCLLGGDSADISEFGSFALGVGADQRSGIRFSPSPDILKNNPPTSS